MAACTLHVVLPASKGKLQKIVFGTGVEFDGNGVCCCFENTSDPREGRTVVLMYLKY